MKLNRTVVGAVILSLILVSCMIPADETVQYYMTGYWVSAGSNGDGFEITTDNKIFQYTDSYKTIRFAGDIVNNSTYTGESGFATVKITNSGAAGLTNGWYTVIRWRYFDGYTCQETYAYKDSYPTTASSKALAESTFTEENGYFDYWNAYYQM
jgi:hypothetical protein